MVNSWNSVSALSPSSKKKSSHQKFNFAELEENEQNLKRLRKWMLKIQKRDFFISQKSQAAIATFENCQRQLRAYTLQVYALEGIDSNPDGDSFISTG